MTSDAYPWSAGFRSLNEEHDYRIEEIDGQVPASLLLYYAQIPPDGYVQWASDPGQPAGEASHLRPGDEGPFLLVGTREHDEKISHFTEVQRLGDIIIPIFTGDLRRFYLDRLDGFKGLQP